MTTGAWSREAKLPGSCVGWQARRRARRQISRRLPRQIRRPDGRRLHGRERPPTLRVGGVPLADLKAKKPIVESLAPQQVAMGAPFHDPPFFDEAREKRNPSRSLFDRHPDQRQQRIVQFVGIPDHRPGLTLDVFNRRGVECADLPDGALLPGTGCRGQQQTKYVAN